MRTGLCVADAMTKKPIRIPKNITVRECARIMRDKDIGSVLVVEDEELLGIITEEDIVERVVAEGTDPETTSVADVMTEELITVQPQKDIVDALALMRDHDVRHLPVLAEGGLVGFLTVKDVLKIEPQLFEILLDSIDLREEERKLALRTTDIATEGFCEVCGNFSERLTSARDQRLTCPDCRLDKPL